jgi:hypothetical protein
MKVRVVQKLNTESRGLPVVTTGAGTKQAGSVQYNNDASLSHIQTFAVLLFQVFFQQART